MVWFVARKLLGMVVTLFITSFLVFSSLYVAPGDPLDFLIQGRSPTPEMVAAVSAQYGLDDPFLVQYWHWLPACCTSTSAAPCSSARTSRT